LLIFFLIGVFRFGVLFKGRKEGGITGGGGCLWSGAC